MTILQPLRTADRDRLRRVRYVLTDMDDTLTYDGRLAAATFAALERLQMAGIRVIPVTAAPAGWCDQMARMWPVDCVIGENGGLYFQAGRRVFWQQPQDIAANLRSLEQVAAAMDGAVIAPDQAFRLTSMALNAPQDPAERSRLAAAFRAAGCSATINSLWVLGWLGDYDKRSMAGRMMAECFNVDITKQQAEILYVGDSINDQPMFAAFPNSVGVSTIVDYVDDMTALPSWITQGPGGAGFVEVADALIAAMGG